MSEDKREFNDILERVKSEVKEEVRNEMLENEAKREEAAKKEANNPFNKVLAKYK